MKGTRSAVEGREKEAAAMDSEEGVEEEIRAPREAAASLAQLELAGEGIQEEEEKEEE